VEGWKLNTSKLELLIFAVGNCRYGIIIDQIAALRNFAAGQTAISFTRLMDRHCHFSGESAKMLVIKQRTELPILIPEPECLEELPILDMLRLPKLLTAAARRGVWGFWPQDQGLIILVDFYKNQLFEHLIKNPLTIRKETS
jgi:chemotaxis signal transduction protein